MARYLIRRLLQGIAVLFGIALITFALMHAVPGGPFDLAGGDRPVSAQFVAAQEGYYGLDAPWPEQFGGWLWRILQGDLGLSFANESRTVRDVLLDGITPSLLLGGMAFAIVLAIGVPLGAYAASRANSRADRLTVVASSFLGALPSFVLAFLLLLVFAVWLDLAPVRIGRDFGETPGSLARGILPALALASTSLALMTRITRGSMLETLNEDYIRTARAKGLANRTIYGRHALRNALMPVATLSGPLFAELITGSIVIEQIFGVPGIGSEFISSVLKRDYGVIMGTTMFFATAIVVMNILVDLSYPLLDPRVRLGSR